tara:strand:+ start:249 stop:1022 length:774 start_codon:yes stop_codon:yes gene_type:complete
VIDISGLSPLKMETLRPDEPLETVFPDDIPEDVKMNYSSLPLETLRPDSPLRFEEFEDNPEDIDFDYKELDFDPVAMNMLVETEELVGTPVMSDGTSLVALSVLQKHSKDDGKYQVITDLNTNTSTVMLGKKFIVQYNIGTADTTGTRYNKKYYTPSGETKIQDKGEPPGVAGEQSYAPYWMGLGKDTFNTIGFHGPWESEEKIIKDGRFINDGRISHGCIRYKAEDLNELAGYVKNGTRVYVIPYNNKKTGTGSTK